MILETSGSIEDTNAASLNVIADTLTILGNAAVGTSTKSIDINVNTLALTSKNTYVAERGNVEFNTSVITGDLFVLSVGDITDSGDLIVTGHADFNSGNAKIELGSATDETSFNSLTFSGGVVKIQQDSDMVIEGSNNATSLELSANGSIVDTNAVSITVTDTADFTSIKENALIDLSKLAVLNAVTVDTAGDKAKVVIVNDSALKLGGTVTGSLDATSTKGSISDSSVLTVGGTADFKAAEGADIILNETDNSFAGIVSFNAIANKLNDITFTNDKTLTLGAIDIDGDLKVTAQGNISSRAPLIVGASSTFETTKSDATINLSSLNSIGAVSLTTTGALADVTINSTAVLKLEGSIGGKLSATTTVGNITDSAVLTVAGTSSFTTTESNAAIILDQLSSQGAVSVNTLGNATIVNTAVIESSDPLKIGLDLAESSIGGNLTATAVNGNLIDSGEINVTGSSTFTAENIDVGTLASTGYVSVTATADRGDVTIVNASTLDLRGDVKGDLIATAQAGNIKTLEALTVAGDASFTAAKGADVLLNHQDNSFKGVIDFTALAEKLHSISIVDSSTTGIALKALELTGDLSVSVKGDVTNPGALIVAGTTTIEANGNDVTLGAANNFNKLGVNGKDVDIIDVSADGLERTASTITGSFDLDVKGNVSNTGTLIVTKDTTIQASGQNVSLNVTTNNFSKIGVNGKNVTINDVNAIELADSKITGDLTITAGGDVTAGKLDVAAFTKINAQDFDITLESDNNFRVIGVDGRNVKIKDIDGIDLAASSVTGALTVTANGDVTNSGQLLVANLAQINAAGHNITLDFAANDFNKIGVLGHDVVITDANDIDLAKSIVTGTLTVNAGNNVINSGQLDITNKAQIEARGNVTLTVADNNFSSIGVNAASVLINDANGIVLSESNITGNLTVTAGGAITDNGFVDVKGNANFTTGGTSSINFDSIKIAGSAAFNTFNLTLNTAAINFSTSNIRGDLQVTTTAGDITDSGNLTVAGKATLNAQRDIILGDSGSINNFATIAASGRNVNIKQTGNMRVEKISATGAVTLESLGSIVDHAFDNIIDIVAADLITLKAVNGVGVGGLVLDLGSNVQVSATTNTGNIELDAAGSIASLVATSGTGNIVVTAAQNMTLSDVRGDHVSLTSTGGSILIGASKNSVQAVSAIELTAKNDIGSSSSPLNFTLDLSGKASLRSTGQGSIHLSTQATLLLNKVDSVLVGNLVSATSQSALEAGLQEFVVYLVSIDDALFNEFVTIFDVEGMKLPEGESDEAEEEEFTWLTGKGKVLAKVKTNTKFMTLFETWQRYGKIFMVKAQQKTAIVANS